MPHGSRWSSPQGFCEARRTKIYGDDSPGIESEFAEPFRAILGDEVAVATAANTNLSDREIDQRWTAIAADRNSSEHEPELVGAGAQRHGGRQV